MQFCFVFSDEIYEQFADLRDEIYMSLVHAYQVDYSVDWDDIPEEIDLSYYRRFVRRMTMEIAEHIDNIIHDSDTNVIDVSVHNVIIECPDIVAVALALAGWVQRAVADYNDG